LPLDGPTLMWLHFVVHQFPQLAPSLAAWTDRGHKELCRADAELTGLRNSVLASERAGDHQAVQTKQRQLAQRSLAKHRVLIANGRLHDSGPEAPHAGSQRDADPIVLACGAALLGKGGPRGAALMTVHKIDNGHPGDLITFRHVGDDMDDQTDGGLYLIVAGGFTLEHDRGTSTVLPPHHLSFGTGGGRSD
jgi:hypothetical protein